MLEGKLIVILALGHQNKSKSSFTGSGFFVLMSQCRNNHELALQHGGQAHGFCTMWSFVAKVAKVIVSKMAQLGLFWGWSSIKTPKTYEKNIEILAMLVLVNWRTILFMQKRHKSIHTQKQLYERWHDFEKEGKLQFSNYSGGEGRIELLGSRKLAHAKKEYWEHIFYIKRGKCAQYLWTRC